MSLRAEPGERMQSAGEGASVVEGSGEGEVKGTLGPSMSRRSAASTATSECSDFVRDSLSGGGRRHVYRDRDEMNEL